MKRQTSLVFCCHLLEPVYTHVKIYRTTDTFFKKENTNKNKVYILLLSFALYILNVSWRSFYVGTYKACWQPLNKNTYFFLVSKLLKDSLGKCSHTRRLNLKIYMSWRHLRNKMENIIYSEIWKLLKIESFLRNNSEEMWWKSIYKSIFLGSCEVI